MRKNDSFRIRRVRLLFAQGRKIILEQTSFKLFEDISLRLSKHTWTLSS